MLNENAPFKIRDGVVCVCCCCFPGSSITAIFPDLAGKTLSHGYCKKHLAEMLAILKSEKK